MKIAILLATYNSEKYIKDQIDSILTQDYNDYVCYIHDDDSSDGTVDILKEYEAQNPDKIMILNYDATHSAMKNFMSMLRYVDSDYYMFCDHDDVWIKDKIMLSVNRMREVEKDCTTPTLIFGDLSVVNSQLEIINPSLKRFKHYRKLHRLCLENILLRNPTFGCTMFFNRALALKMLEYKNIDNIIMHDYWCAIVAVAFGRISYIDTPLVLYRQHDDNVCGVKETKRIFTKIFKAMKSDREELKEKKEKKKRWIQKRIQQVEELLYLSDLPQNAKSQCNKFLKVMRKENKIKRLFYILVKDSILWGPDYSMLFWG